MKQALVDEVDCGTEDLYREKSKDLALDEEDDLHHNGEHGVGYHDGDGEIYQRSALGRPKCKISDILEPNGVNNLGEKEERKDPEGGKCHGENGLGVAPHSVSP